MSLREDAMDAQITVSLIASFTSLAVAVAGIPLNYLIGKRLRREQNLNLMSYYRDPLLQAAADLRSRLITILAENFLSRFLTGGEESQRFYARTYTMFVFAEFLCWVEILRQSVSFLDLGNDTRNARLMRHLSITRRVLFDSKMDPLFRIHNGYQRALGEVMIRESDPSRPRDKHCIGYAGFCIRLETDETFARWFEGLATDIAELAGRESARVDRLVTLTTALEELIDFLDPDNVRYPMRQPWRFYESKSENLAGDGMN
jgi:hypothetical protein